jgi:hypothetical protein
VSAIAEYCRLWLAGQVANAMIVVQRQDGTWTVIGEDHVPKQTAREMARGPRRSFYNFRVKLS